MNSLAALLAPFAPLWPAVAADAPDRPRPDQAAHSEAEKDAGPPTGFDATGAEPFRALRDAHRPPLLGQVRIEQRVIIRIAPSTTRARQQLMSQLPRRSEFEERKIDGCVPLEGIAGVQPAPQQNRLLLFMRDRRILSAALERACQAEDYYSGFYVERSDDGQLCPGRERLQSRAGASCRVTQLSRLVALRD